MRIWLIQAISLQMTTQKTELEKWWKKNITILSTSLTRSRSRRRQHKCICITYNDIVIWKLFIAISLLSIAIVHRVVIWMKSESHTHSNGLAIRSVVYKLHTHTNTDSECCIFAKSILEKNSFRECDYRKSYSFSRYQQRFCDNA